MTLSLIRVINQYKLNGYPKSPLRYSFYIFCHFFGAVLKGKHKDKMLCLKVLSLHVFFF